MKMKNKIFIFTDAYTARIFLYCFKFISVYSEFEFIFLSETDAFIKMQTESVINTCETLQECVENSTEILIVKNKYIPDNKINFIIDLAQTQNKRYIVFPGWDDNSEKGDDICFTSHLPSILLRLLDNKIEVSCWESAINKLLIDSNYKVYQRKTSEFKFILNLLKSCNIINEKILCDKFSSLPDCNIVVNTIQYKINSY